MTKYKRFISYMYCYELGKKTKNIGFARVETSMEVCKITIDCVTKAISEKECQIYLLYENKGEMAGIKVASIRANQGELKWKARFVEGSIPGETLSFYNVIGVLCKYSKDYYIAAKWDNSALHYREVANIENIRQSNENTMEEEEKETKNMEIPEVNHILLPNEVQNAEISEKEIKIVEIPKEEIEEINRVSEVEKMEEVFETDMEPEESISTDIIPEEEKISVNELDEEILEPQELENDCKDEKEEPSWIDHPGARAILNRFVRMYPFDDGEIAECVRLEPRDIGLLPMNAWTLGNNSFLQHAYYSYRHLLFAKKLTKEGCLYLLMVPGVLNPKERELAAMFGFSDFKCSRRRSVRNGEFGYWYVQINFQS